MEKVIKYSRQREAIKDMLCNRYDHPTAEQLYSDLKPDYPKLSLGTVYRNLSLLVNMGEAIRISTNSESERYDGNVHNHYHMACTKCGSVIDVDLPVNDALESLAEEVTNAEIKTHSLIFYGICKNCKKKLDK